MVDATSRLKEARKQIRIVGETTDDESVVSELNEADAILEKILARLREDSSHQR